MPSSRPTSPALKAVLLDSGGVLMQPIGGRWNPRADFEATVARHVPGVTPEQLATAVAESDRFFAAAPGTTPDSDDYHRALLAAIDVEPTPELLADLVRPVPASEVLETFPDVIPTLAELKRRNVRLAVVSDAWPNLPELHDELGFGDYFEGYAISAELGCTKPDPRMYHHASALLGVDPEQCVFVDDVPELVAAAIRLGYHGRVMSRNAAAADGSLPWISSLSDLLDLF
jgi:putative hydrolase of the HAD superfamily